MTEKQWDGRFQEKTDELVEAFTASIDYDRRLYPYDIEGSIAHCRMLAKCAVISMEEADQLVTGLEAVKAELDQGTFEFKQELEDIHMHIEARLTEKIGPVAQKLHTARSRNDQVALDIRMYLRDAVADIITETRRLQQVLVDLAETHLTVALPGYTHTQRAQPILLSHHFMAYFEMFNRDVQRFSEGLARINVLPLGAAALAGTTYPIDRQYTAELLGFEQVSINSVDAVSDRDFIMEFLSSASICMIHMSRLAEELILWSSSEFGFVELPDAFATGSSIMPQKKNPDVLELVRGKCGRVIGDLMAILTVLKSLPLSYNRDMQEDKEPLFDAVDTLGACIAILGRMLPHIKINAKTMREAASVGFLNATDLADYLSERGMPFRKAHHCAGQAVAHALAQNKELHELPLEQLQTFSSLIQEDVYEYLTVEAMIQRRESYGGTAADKVRFAIAAAKDQLARQP